MSLKVAHQGNDITEGWIIQALDEAIDQKVDLINLSLGKTRNCQGSCTLCDYVNAVSDLGITVVAASGNSGHKHGNTIDCPGAAEMAITVGEIDNTGKLSSTSGRGIPGFDKPNLLAPGYVNVTLGTATEFITGTSFATPVITGILSSLFQLTDKHEEVITNLYNTCKTLRLPRHEQGFGAIQLTKFVEVCKEHGTISNKSSGQGSN